MNQLELENKIKKAQEAYYSGNEIMTDLEFDALWDELSEKYPNSDLLKEIGSDLTSKSGKIKHIMNMGSQSKFNTEEGFRDWIKNENIQFPILVQHKLDGASIELQYENGNFLRAVTRGDGKYGEDVTRAFKEGVNGFPLILKDKFSGAVRGELVMFNDIFNKKYASEFKNPRNLVAGMIKNENINDFSDLSIICYDVFSKDCFVFETETDKMSFMINHGFYVVPNIKMNEIDAVINYRESLALKVKLKDMPVNIDGLVIKQDICDKNDLIETRPKKQHAFKFEDCPEVTFVRGIEWSLSGSTLTPVAIMDPVEIEGTTVTRASLANPRLIKELGLQINDKVEVTKRGMIIPKIERVVEHMPDSYPVEYPDTCPICDSEVILTDTEIKCSNSRCPGKKRHQIEKWIYILDAKGFGETLIDFMFNKAHIESVLDLYNEEKILYVKENYYSKVNAEKAFKDLELKSKNITLSQFIAGYDIDGIGLEIAQSLVDYGFDTFDKLNAFITETESTNIKISKLCEINGWSDTRANSFLVGMRQNLTNMNNVIKKGIVTISENIVTGIKESPMNGKKICVTGKLEKFNRKEIEQFIKDHGMIAQSGVNKETDYLVTNDPDSGSSKNKNAQKFGIPIISEVEFIKLVNGE